MTLKKVHIRYKRPNDVRQPNSANISISFLTRYDDMLVIFDLISTITIINTDRYIHIILHLMPMISYLLWLSSHSLSLVFFFYPMSFVIVRCEIISALVPLSTSFLSIGFMYESMMKKRLPLLPALKKSYLWEKCLSVFFFLLSPNINVLL